MLRTITTTPTKISNPPTLILNLKNGLLQLTTPITLKIKIKPSNIRTKPTTGKNPVIISMAFKNMILDASLKISYHVMSPLQI